MMPIINYVVLKKLGFTDEEDDFDDSDSESSGESAYIQLLFSMYQSVIGNVMMLSFLEMKIKNIILYIECA